MKFTYESDILTDHIDPNLSRMLEIEFDPIVESECDGYAENITVFDPYINEYILEENLPKKDWENIQNKADELVYENVYDLYLDMMRSRAEMLYDMSKEGE